MRRITRALVMLAAMAAAGGAGMLASCTVGPSFHQPHVKVESQFDLSAPGASTQSGQKRGAISTTAPVVEWWRTFQDPELDRLVKLALANNMDLQIATARIRESRAQRGIAAAELFPEVDTSAGYNLARGSNNVKLPLGGLLSSGSGTTGAGTKGVTQPLQSLDTSSSGGSSSSAQSGNTGAALLSPFGEGGLPGVTTSLYQAGFDANWELDIFGGHRRDLEAAAADLAAADENRRAVAVTLLAEVARNYLELRAAQQRLVVARENLAAQNDILTLTRKRRQHGFTTDLDVTRAAGEVSTTAATVPPLEAQVRMSEHAMAILLAKSPTELQAELDTAAPLPVLPPQVPVGLPSQLLLRRPDIREALLQIHAATARVGSATADLFPKFALTGSVGLDASKVSQLFQWDSRYFLISPTVTWPIFDAGRIASNIRLKKAGAQEAVLQYRKVILTALREVDDALVQYAMERVRNQSLVQALGQNKQALNIAKMQYRQGLTNFIDVLDAQRSVLALEDQVAQSRALEATNLVALYKALGGGWQTTDAH